MELINSKQTPLDFALRKGHKGIIGLLIGKGGRCKQVRIRNQCKGREEKLIIVQEQAKLDKFVQEKVRAECQQK